MTDKHTHTHADDATHTHTHADGTTHSHADGTVHTHADGTTHSHAIVGSQEEAIAMLRYMLSHNQHHAAELHDLSHCFEAEIEDLLHDAVDRLSESNDLMEQALALLDNSSGERL